MDQENPTAAVAPEHPPGSVQAALLVDARNGFNELGRKAMLWTVRHRWAAGSRFAFNCYRHSGQLIVRRPGQPCYTILSQEGVTQGDALSMVLYGLALLPLSQRLRQEVPTLLQPWYADDCAMGGSTGDIATAMHLLQTLGPARGYFPEPEKSIIVCPSASLEAARQALSAFDFRFCTGHRYLGGFLGDASLRQDWIRPQVEKWKEGVRVLAKIAKRFPQTAYAGLSQSLQSEWQYLQRIAPNCSNDFAAIEHAIQTAFLPALFGDNKSVTGPLCRTSCAQLGLGSSRP
jgi:hypothetical protein